MYSIGNSLTNPTVSRVLSAFGLSVFCRIKCYIGLYYDDIPLFMCITSYLSAEYCWHISVCLHNNIMLDKRKVVVGEDADSFRHTVMPFGQDVVKNRFIHFLYGASLLIN